MNGPTEVIVCGICGAAIHRQRSWPIMSRASVDSRTSSKDAASLLTAMMLDAERVHQEMLKRAEDACVRHFEERHPRRLRLFRRYGWKWLMRQRFPWEKPKMPEFVAKVPA